MENDYSNLTSPFIQTYQCWQISDKHLSHVAKVQLFEAIKMGKDYDKLMFNLFPFPSVERFCIGVKLLSVPWNDLTLKYQFDLSTSELFKQQQAAGLPECFLNIIHLAAKAYTRLIIFDPLAEVLSGLPVIDKE